MAGRIVKQETRLARKLRGDNMSRTYKIQDYELLKYLEDEEVHPNKVIAVTFKCTVKTARKAVKRLREDGHLILPTNDGQLYLRKVKTLEQAIYIQNTIAWAARIQTPIRLFVNSAKKALASAPKKLQIEAPR